MEKTIVLGVLLGRRMNNATKFQEIISKHGCNIKTRIGLHNVDNNKCSPSGVILLEVIGEEGEIQAIESDIKALPETQVQKMEFCY